MCSKKMNKITVAVIIGIALGSIVWLWGAYKIAEYWGIIKR